MFDTLDRLRDLCHSVSGAGSALPTLAGAHLPRYDMQDDEHLDLFHCIIEFCDDLSGEMDAVQADLFPHLQKDAAHRWMGFEMRLHLREMRALALMEHKMRDAQGSAVDRVLALAGRIRNLLRSIDQ
jgi:hypothetical protein